MQIYVVLTVIGAAIAAVPGAWDQRPLAEQAGGNIAHDAGTSNSLSSLTTNLEEYIEDVMERWHAPGMAVAIIKGEETWTKGFGYASLEPPTPVTPNTLFLTGSTTKSFVAAGLSLLIDNSSDYSNIQWETPVSQLLRDDFVLSDDLATAHITVEDALCHRTGYPRHDLSVGNDTRETVRKLRHLPLSAEPRTKFQYNNMMFTAAGYLITKLTGYDLGEFLHKYLWTPMGMNETFLGPYDLVFKSSGLSLADSYLWEASTRSFARNPDFDRGGGEAAIRGDEGAGAVISNVVDYVKYLRVMMAEAGPISKAGHRELKTPRTFHDLNVAMFGPVPLFYGLGWMGTVFEGEQVYWHTGTMTSFVTFMVIVPEREYGVVVLANAGSKVRELVTYRVLYDLFGVEEGKRRDFEKLFREEEESVAKSLATCSDRLYPNIPEPPIPASVSLASHVGHYRHPAYDSIFISLECEDEKPDSMASSLSSAQDEGCQLRLARGPESQVPFHGKLSHKTGDYWLSYLYEDWFDMVQDCVRTQFRVDASGTVNSIGIDIRMEGESIPLVWFDRVG